ncbi:hypothetical protein [Pilimelia columellifera]|uniref:Uncharacterized protein n=1 Tax=Pilimelia columellifera subsp. columellifera TaxID=706583 RepID=A0ABN3NHN5_9ACTN
MDGPTYAAPSVPPPRRSRGERFRGAAVLVGLLTSAALVWQSTQAAFSSVTDNQGNSFAAGSVTLTENDADNVLFAVTGLVPGGTGNNCIEVEYDGNVAAEVRLYINTFAENDGAADGALLDSELRLYIQMGDVDDTCGVANGWSAVSAVAPGDYVEPTLKTKSNFATGYDPGWNPSAANTVRAFRVTYTMDSDATNTAQGDSLSFNFAWEAQNT